MKWYHILIIASSIILFALAIFLVIKYRKNKSIEYDFSDLLLALGGKENINEVSYKGSRVNVFVNNKKIIDKEAIKNEGIETIVISNNKITMVTGNKMSEIIFSYLNGETK